MAYMATLAFGPNIEYVHNGKFPMHILNPKDSKWINKFTDTIMSALVVGPLTYLCALQPMMPLTAVINIFQVARAAGNQEKTKSTHIILKESVKQTSPYKTVRNVNSAKIRWNNPYAKTNIVNIQWISILKAEVPDIFDWEIFQKTTCSGYFV